MRAQANSYREQLTRSDLVDKVVSIADFIPGDQDEKLYIIDEMSLLLGDLSVATQPDPETQSPAARLAAVRAFQEKLQEVRTDDPVMARLRANLAGLLEKQDPSLSIPFLRKQESTVRDSRLRRNGDGVDSHLRGNGDRVDSPLSREWRRGGFPLAREWRHGGFTLALRMAARRIHTRPGTWPGCWRNRTRPYPYHSCESRNPLYEIPAYAGMATEWIHTCAGMATGWIHICMGMAARRIHTRPGNGDTADSHLRENGGTADSHSPGNLAGLLEKQDPSLSIPFLRKQESTVRDSRLRGNGDGVDSHLRGNGDGVDSHLHGMAARRIHTRPGMAAQRIHTCVRMAAQRIHTRPGTWPGCWRNRTRPYPYHSCESRNPLYEIPAYAGMATRRIYTCMGMAAQRIHTRPGTWPSCWRNRTRPYPYHSCESRNPLYEIPA